MIGSRVIDDFGIGDERAEDRAEIKQLGPIAVVTRETTGFQREHQPDVAQADLRHKLLKSRAPISRSSATAQILIDDLNAVFGPTERDGSIDQGILSDSTFDVV